MRIGRLRAGMRTFLPFWEMVGLSLLFIFSIVLTFRVGFDTREFDGRDITNYLGLLGKGDDVQPEYSDELLKKLAGWTVGK